MENQPKMHDLLFLRDDPAEKLEVFSSAGPARFFCFALTGNKDFQRGGVVLNSGEQISIPVGEEIFGRAFDIFGKAHDKKDKIQTKDSAKIYFAKPVRLEDIELSSQVLETGIKAIDFFTPILKGGRTGLFGGAGVGKTIILSELINNLLLMNQESKDRVSVFGAVGERSREAQELYDTLFKNDRNLPITLILGLMGDNPAIRSRTAFASATIAEYLRDYLEKDVMFFIDNVYRFAQAGHELSNLMGNIPSEDGYQPTITSEMGTFHKKLVSTQKAAITSFEAIFVPSDDITDYGVRSVFPYLDNSVILSRDLYQQGQLPAIDLLSSTSNALNADTIGEEHYHLFIRAKSLLEKSTKLERIVSLIGFSELSFGDQLAYKRANLLKSYMSQSFFTVQEQTGRAGSYVPLEVTLRDVKEILRGTHDKLNPEEIRFVGGIREGKIK